MLEKKGTIVSEKENSSLEPGSFASTVNQYTAIHLNKLLLNAKAKNGWKEKIKRQWDRFLFKPTSTFKVKWDLIIIVIALWNSI